MAGNELGMAGMAESGWRWLKITGLPGNTWYGWKWMAGNSRKWIKRLEMDRHEWKWLEIA